MSRAAARLTTTIAVLAALAVAVPTGGIAAPGCVGAAARDPHHPCTNASRTIAPPMGARALLPSTFDCTPVRPRPALVCAFGASARTARKTVALVGDSHAQHWRAALEPVARAKRWRGYSLVATTCPFSAAVAQLPSGLRARCVRWYAEAHAWFAHHPEVSTVFVSQKADTPVAGPGRSERQLKTAGYLRAWRTLPKTVKRVIVLRDVPDPRNDTFACLDRALVAGTPPLASACPSPRAAALLGDVAATTARALRSRRYRVIDLTSLFCDPRNCFPVIGGVQVYYDIVGHVTAAYMRTVAPYLLRRLGG